MCVRRIGLDEIRAEIHHAILSLLRFSIIFCPRCAKNT